MLQLRLTSGVACFTFRMDIILNRKSRFREDE